MDILNINPYIRHASRSVLPAPWYINRRIILDYELLYIDAGEFTLIYDDVTYHCKAGDLLLLCPDIPHSFIVDTVSITQPHIHFDLSYDHHSALIFISYQDRDQLSESHKKMIRENIFPGRTSPFLQIPDKKHFLELFFQVIDTTDRSSLLCRSNMMILIQMILEQVPATLTDSSTTNLDIAPLVKAYVDAHYRQHITLDTLADFFRYSKFHIEKAFQQKYGTSVIRYRNQKRMEAAPDLLKTSHVSQVATVLGYSSVYVFSRAFRLHYGHSPTSYLRATSSGGAKTK